MSAKDTRYILLQGANRPAPAPQTCERVATNQRGESAFFFEPVVTTWEGQTSLETGTHGSFKYELQGDGTWQQYLVMSGVSGSFADGEVIEEA